MRPRRRVIVLALLAVALVVGALAVAFFVREPSLLPNGRPMPKAPAPPPPDGIGAGGPKGVGGGRPE